MKALFLVLAATLTVSTSAFAIGLNDSLGNVSKGSYLVANNDLVVLANQDMIEFKVTDTVNLACTLHVEESVSERVLKAGSILMIDRAHISGNSNYMSAEIYFESPKAIKGIACAKIDNRGRYLTPTLGDLVKALFGYFTFYQGPVEEI